MRKLLYIVLSFLLLASCVGQRRYDTSLRRVQILLNDAPDSALVLLDSMESFSSNFSRSTWMRWQLLRLLAQNKCDTVFRNDSIQLALVDYFNRHGTPNERMTAHYLLGRAYSDMGESPLALRAYQVAVSCADTTSSDCDWWNLCRVYFNLSVLFYDHGMPKQLHWALEQAGVSAMKAGDTLSAIMAVNKMAQVYELTGDRDSLDLMARQAAQMFSSVGREDLAAQSLSWTIMDDLSKGLTKEAEVKIKMYEGKSGFFDEKHQIVSGKEIFYFTKGNYYLAVNMPDSAENIFRQLLQADKDINLRHAAYVGLRARYQYGGPTDSLVKYAILSEAYNDSLHQEEYVASLLRTQYSYNYSRQYEQALISKAESDRKGRIILEMEVAGVLFLLGLFLYYRYKRSQTRQRFQIFKEKLETLTHLNEEKEILIRENQTAQEKIAAALQLKDQEIQEKTIQLAQYSESLKLEVSRDLDQTLQNAFISIKLREKFKKPNSTVSVQEWMQLDDLFRKSYPGFYTHLCDPFSLTPKERRVCELVRLNFKPFEIAVLLENDPSSITQIRKRLHAKLTGGQGNAKALDDWLRMIPRF